MSTGRERTERGLAATAALRNGSRRKSGTKWRFARLFRVVGLHGGSMKAAIVVIASLALAACGGSSSSAPPAPADLGLTASGALPGGRAARTPLPAGGRAPFGYKARPSIQVP